MVVDRDADVLSRIRDTIGYDDTLPIVTCRSVDEALAHLAITPCYAVFARYQMTDTDSLAFLRTVRTRHPDVPFIFFAGTAQEEEIDEAFTSGNDLFLPTINGDSALEPLVRRLAAQRQTVRHLGMARIALERAGDLVFWLDADGRFVYVNETASALLGYSREEFMAMTLADIDPAFPAERWPEGWEEMKRRRRVSHESSHLTRGGTMVPLEIRGEYLLFDGREYLCAIARDISEHKQAMEAVQEANKKLNLLSGITRHDILNQVTALSGYLHLLGREVAAADNPKMQEYLERCKGAAETIQRQISFTRDYEALGVHGPAWQSMDEAVRRAAAAVLPAEVGLRAEIGALEVYADPMLEKVFFNLMENAVRHGDGVTGVRVGFSGDESGGIIVVEDDGAGVPDEEKSSIFEVGFGRKSGGFGLFLVQSILAITGMTIAETGREGEGARFEIRVPPGGYREGKGW
ncbi:ATP-binding response regulator [Methanofollis formosanus]|nr:hybrid sensor histidine kinase/response regulator [Methanofollis formosanus]